MVEDMTWIHTPISQHYTIEQWDYYVGKRILHIVRQPEETTYTAYYFMDGFYDINEIGVFPNLESAKMAAETFYWRMYNA